MRVVSGSLLAVQFQLSTAILWLFKEQRIRHDLMNTFEHFVHKTD